LELWAMTDINRWKPDCWKWCNEISSTGVVWLKVWVKIDITVLWEHTGMRKLYPKKVLNCGHWQKRNVGRPGKGWG